MSNLLQIIHVLNITMILTWKKWYIFTLRILYDVMILASRTNYFMPRNGLHNRQSLKTCVPHGQLLGRRAIEETEMAAFYQLIPHCFRAVEE